MLFPLPRDTDLQQGHDHDCIMSHGTAEAFWAIIRRLIRAGKPICPIPQRPWLDAPTVCRIDWMDAHRRPKLCSERRGTNIRVLGWPAHGWRQRKGRG